MLNAAVQVVHCGRVDYVTALETQERLAAAVAAGTAPETLLLLEHPAVYTIGRGGDATHLLDPLTDLRRVNRGGKITWHGPGQLVGYPIVFLPRGIGVVDYVRRVEEALIRVLSDYGIHTGRVDGRTGVWLAAGATRPERKIAAIGIRVSKQTTMHGFALNVTSQLAGFDNIVPCGIPDAGVTSMAAELDGPPPSLVEVAGALEPHLGELLALREYERAPEFASTSALTN